MTEYKLGCPQCGQHIKCTEAYFGKQIDCPTCRQAIIVAPRKKTTPQPATSAAPAGRKSNRWTRGLAIGSVVLLGLALTGFLWAWLHFAQQRADQREARAARRLPPRRTASAPRVVRGVPPATPPTVKKTKVLLEEIGPGTNSVTPEMLTLIEGSTLQVSLGDKGFPVTFSVQSPNLPSLSLDPKKLTRLQGQTVWATNVLKGYGDTTMDVTGNPRYSLAFGPVIAKTSGRTTQINALPNGPRVSIASFQSANMSSWLAVRGGGHVTIAGSLTNISRGTTLLYITDGTTLTLQGPSTISPMATNRSNPYRYCVANGTLVLANDHALTNNVGGLNPKRSCFILGPATGFIDPAREVPRDGLLIATNNRCNAAVYLGEPDSAGGLTLDSTVTNHVADGDTGFVNSGVFTIGAQNTSGINTYANPIVLGWTENAGKSVTLVAATGGQADFAGGIFVNGSDRTAGVTVGNATHAGLVTFPAENTYGGDTFITNGTLALTGSGSIARSARIVVAAGALFDVSRLNSPFSLQPGQILGSRGSNARIKGNLNASSGVLALRVDTNGPPLSLIEGTLTLGSTTTVELENAGPMLNPGDYPLIAGTNGGRVASSAELPSVRVTGLGMAAGARAKLKVLNGELHLSVAEN